MAMVSNTSLAVLMTSALFTKVFKSSLNKFLTTVVSAPALLKVDAASKVLTPV